MRWKIEDHLGETRIVKRFLLLPKKIDDEWRWLEVAYIKQELKLYFFKEWESQSWADKGAYDYFQSQ